jgi:hypothetical protein
MRDRPLNPNGKPRITKYRRKSTPPPEQVPPELSPGNVGDLPDTIPIKSEIDKSGMGTEVVRLRKAGLTHAEIGIQLGFSQQQVAGWLSKYRSMTEEQRLLVHHRSVFNLADNLEETFKDIYDVLERVRGQNADMELKALDRLLKAQERAAVLVEKIEMYKENERFKETVLDLLDQEAPGIKAKALKKLAEFKEGVSALRPL